MYIYIYIYTSVHTHTHTHTHLALTRALPRVLQLLPATLQLHLTKVQLPMHSRQRSHALHIQILFTARFTTRLNFTTRLLFPARPLAHIRSPPPRPFAARCGAILFKTVGPYCVGNPRTCPRKLLFQTPERARASVSNCTFVPRKASKLSTGVLVCRPQAPLPDA